MQTPPLSDLGKGFDNELGLKYIDVTPDGGRAELQIHDKLLQPWGIVHGGVYCSIVEGLASLSGQVWLSDHGGGHVVGVNNNTDFLRAISAGTVTAVSTPIHRGRRIPRHLGILPAATQASSSTTAPLQGRAKIWL